MKRREVCAGSLFVGLKGTFHTEQKMEEGQRANAADPKKIELAETLFAVYRQDHATGILDARLRWEEIDDDVLLITNGWAGSARMELQEVGSVTSLGIDGYEWAFFVEAQNTVSFHEVLETLRRYEGDPPAGDMLKQHALDILSGRMNLPGAIRLVSADRPLLGALPHIFQTFLPGLDPAQYSAMHQAVRVAAAAALPRKNLLQLRGLVPEDPENAESGDGYEEIRNEYRRIMEQVHDSAVSADPRKEEELLVKALDMAVQSPEPDDDLETVGKILDLADRFRLSAYSIRRCVDTLHTLVEKGHHGPEVVDRVIKLAPLIAGLELKRELGQFLVDITTTLLKTPVSQNMRQALATAGARALLWLGKLEEADEVLGHAVGADDDPVTYLEIAMLKAEILKQEKNRGQACDVMLDALEKTRALDARGRLPVLRKVMGMWPENRSFRELRPVVWEFKRAVESLREPKRTLTMIGGVVRLRALNRDKEAREIWSRVDFEKIRYLVPQAVAEKIHGILGQAADKMGYDWDPYGADEETAIKKV
jgi:hypothetical protein